MRMSIAAAAVLLMTGAAAQAQSPYDPGAAGYGAEPQGYTGYDASPGLGDRHPVLGYDRVSRGPHYRVHSAYGPRVRWHAGSPDDYAGGLASYQPYPAPRSHRGIPVVSDIAVAGVSTVAGIVGFGLGVGGFSNWGEQGYGHAYVGHCGCRNGWNF